MADSIIARPCRCFNDRRDGKGCEKHIALEIYRDGNPMGFPIYIPQAEAMKEALKIMEIVIDRNKHKMREPPLPFQGEPQ